MWTQRAAQFACLALFALPPPAGASEQYIYTYDPASPPARRLTDTGLSFQFERGLLGAVRVQRIIQTGDIGAADLKPASEAALGRGGLKAALGNARPAGALYEILPRDEGKSFVHAVCPGADQAWLLIGRIDRFQNLAMQAVGRSATDAGAHLCSSMAFTFRSDLRLPDQDTVPPARLMGHGPD
jgi:hypothetical protein